MVASKTSDKLCLIYTKEGEKRDTFQQKQADRTISLTIQIPVTAIGVMVIPAMTAPSSRNTAQSFEIDMPNGCTFIFDMIAAGQIKPKAPKYTQLLPRKEVPPSSSRVVTDFHNVSFAITQIH